MTKRLNKVGVAALWAVIIGAAAALIAAPCEVHAVQVMPKFILCRLTTLTLFL